MPLIAQTCYKLLQVDTRQEEINLKESSLILLEINEQMVSMVEKQVKICLNGRKFGVGQNEAKVNTSHASTILLYLSHTFTLTFTQTEVGVHALQIEHLNFKSPKNLREVKSTRKMWEKSRLDMSCTCVCVCLHMYIRTYLPHIS